MNNSNRNSGNFDDYYKQLEGMKIHKYMGMGEDGFPRFILKKRGYEDTQIEVSRDPEGNEGGFLFIGETDESKVSPSRELR
jgi:hypothetical protein|tara:strand:- start:383 stop:625 length:243 start_codon:yes stop_codon:yes gene_type:complete